MDARENTLLLGGRQRVGPIDFTACTPADAVAQLIDIATQPSGCHVHLANAYTVALADKSAEFRSLFASPAVNLPDGKPVMWASVLKRQTPRLTQVRGPQLFLDVLDAGRAANIRHFLLGSTPATLAALEANLLASYPGLKIVGTESPAFRPLTPAEQEAQDARIQASGAQIVWVGLGTPKQDFEAARLAGALPIVAIAVGAAFDLAAGTAKPAPVWMIDSGLEWAFRFASEPRRLFTRYVFGNLRFLKAVFVPTPGGRA